MPQGQPVPGITPAEAETAGIRNALNQEDQSNIKIADQKIEFYDELEGLISTMGTYDPEANDGAGGFTLNTDVADIYGSWDGNPLNPQNWNGFGDDGDPGGFGGDTEFFMPQGNRDAKGAVEQLINMLTVDERGKLKGQGQITEGETAMLKAAVTQMQKRGLGEAAISRELAKLMGNIVRRRQRFTDLKQRGQAARGESTTPGLPDGFEVD